MVTNATLAPEGLPRAEETGQLILRQYTGFESRQWGIFVWTGGGKAIVKRETRGDVQPVGRTARDYIESSTQIIGLKAQNDPSSPTRTGCKG